MVGLIVIGAEAVRPGPYLPGWHWSNVRISRKRTIILVGSSIALTYLMSPSIYMEYCHLPAERGEWFLSAIRTREVEYVTRYGQLEPIEDMLSQEPIRRAYGPTLEYVLARYAYSVQGNAQSFEIVATPRSWCFCRPVYRMNRDGRVSVHGGLVGGS
jgi:hypothetical protein